jgi:hypothetical protein
LEEFEPDVVTNNTPAGRVYVLLMDSPSTGGGEAAIHRTREFARQFIEEAVAPGDVRPSST